MEGVGGKKDWTLEVGVGRVVGWGRLQRRIWPRSRVGGRPRPAAVVVGAAGHGRGGEDGPEPGRPGRNEGLLGIYSRSVCVKRGKKTVKD